MYKRQDKYWTAFPRLREDLFSCDGTPYSTLAAEKIKEAIDGSADVNAFIDAYQAAFADFDSYLNAELIEKMQELSVSQEEDAITQNIFDRVAPFSVVDRYQAYQLLDNQWGQISTDLEIIQTEGFAAAKQVDPKMCIRDRMPERQQGASLNKQRRTGRGDILWFFFSFRVLPSF